MKLSSWLPRPLRPRAKRRGAATRPAAASGAAPSAGAAPPSLLALYGVEVIFDIGANVGMSAEGFRTVAIEPGWSNPATREVFQVDVTCFRVERALVQTAATNR